LRTLRTFALGMVSGAILLYALMWRLHAIGIAPPALPSLPPARPTAPRASAVVRPPTPPSREPGESTDNWIPSEAGGLRPDGAFQPAAQPSDMGHLQNRRLGFPLSGYARHQLRDNFAEMRGGRVHEAIDLLAPRGTPVLAVDDGPVAKLFNSKAGGLTVYQFDPDGAYCYYYAHLDRYADGLKDGQLLKRGETIGYVGTTGNAPPDVPHLHFTIFKLGAEKHWWEGMAINPFPLWAMR
jgi:peptidoglycan LD-endopeptidase LytH